jgi:peptidyl-prolyl cis-trans isomerase SurA
MAQLAPRYRGTLDAPTPQLTLPTPTPVSSPRAAVVEDIIVRVNDQIIDRSDVERQRARMQEGIQQGKIPASEVPALERDMLRDMIDEQLLISRGKELDVNVDSEVVRQMDEIRKQNHLDSMEALEKAVRESGISYEDWRADLKNQMIRQTVVRDEVGRTLHRPTTKEEQAFYDAHKQEFTQPEQIRLSEILIPTPENATDAQVAAAQAKADDVVAKLKGGAKFADLAKQVSGGPTADKGGDLGLFKRGALAKVLEDQTFPLKAGEWTQPIRTRQGFVVLSVAEHLDAGAPPLKDVEEQVQEAMFQEQMAPALRKYLTDLREKAYIDIAPGFVDSGASPNEVKPTFAANTPPPVKKKSTAAKKRLETGRSAAVTPVAAVKSGTATSTKPGATVQSATLTGKKKKKVRREKIRFGQAPQNALPAAPQETSSTAGVDQNETSAGNALASPGEVAATTTVADVSTDPLGPVAAPEKKTRFSDRAATEKVTKAKEKSVKAKAKALETPTPMTATEKTTAEVQNSALGLGGDNATKKKKKKQKGEPKERLQQAAPAPAAPKPIATPIPPKTVRENGEPTTTPVPSADKTTLPPANSPAPGANVDTTPATPAQPAGSQPMPPTN